jgi:hypothetical protein
VSGYPINLSNGTLVTTVNPGTFDTTTFNVALLGRGVANYGEITAENFVHMLENFAASQPPGINSNLTGIPTTGQLWYNTSTKQLNVYDTATLPQWRPILTKGDILSFAPGSQTNPGLFPDGDSDTGFFQNSPNTISITTNALEKIRVTDQGRVIVSPTGNPISVVLANSTTPGLSVQQSGISSVAWSSSQPGNIIIARSASNIIGVNQALTNNDEIGSIFWQTSTNNGFQNATSIKSIVTSNVTNSSSPGALIFSTTTTSTTSLQERLRIDENGALFTVIPSTTQTPVNPQDLTTKGYVDTAISTTISTSATLRIINGSPSVPSYNVTVSTLPPSGGVDGDVWYQYNP